MAHLIDPCFRATKIANGIRRSIDGMSPLSGLVPELRILIQEQKNVLTSLKRTAFEKEEAAKHLAIYAKTEGPDISDTLSKLSILIQKAADLERVYADSLAQSRELFKEIRLAEDANFSTRKRKLDLEQKFAVDKTSWSYSTSSLVSNKPGSIHGPQELHPELTLLRQETMTVENELEDLKRKRIKKAAYQQLDALEKLGKEMLVVAHYGRQIITQIDDSPTPAGTHADDRYAIYDGAAKTAYAVKACMDTFETWHTYEPQVQLTEIDLGDFPKDNKQAMDAMLKDLANKTGSDWYSLQSPTSTKSPSTHGRTSSISSSGSASPRNSMSSAMTTTTYIDGVPTVNVINEIPPTPKEEDGPAKQLGDTVAAKPTSSSQEPIPIFVASTTEPAQGNADARPPALDNKSLPDTSAAGTPDAFAAAGSDPSPFVPQSTYKPSTTYYSGQQGHESVEGRKSPASRSRPHSGEHHPSGHAPHPLMQKQPPFHSAQQQQQYQPLYPPGPPGGAMPSQMPMSMPMPMPMPMPMSMPIPYIPGSPGSDDKRHSQPISVSFPLRPQPPSSSTSDHPSGVTSSTATSSSSSAHRPQQSHPPRAPHAVLPPTEPGFHIPMGAGTQSSQLGIEDPSAVYDGPPPDYAEAAMQPPAEKWEEKKRR
ncbi:Eisosome component PIL1-domain-containing protein [Dissophora ornata]|nr:hypothetical protein BGZ58_010282 [Dissophora ornata]KAI8596572.1 Eisosome component PIL1-domain-containing protein [Dissophora ornata]